LLLTVVRARVARQLHGAIENAHTGVGGDQSQWTATTSGGME